MMPLKPISPRTTFPARERYQFPVTFKFRFPQLVVRIIEQEATTTEFTTNPLPENPHGTYGALLFDPRWRARRQEILERDNRQCVLCKSTETLQVHHRQYHFIKEHNQFKAPWDYPSELLISLCEKCHQRGHRQYKVPTIAI